MKTFFESLPWGTKAMAAKPNTAQLVIVALALVALFLPGRAGAIEVKKHLTMPPEGGGSAAQQGGGAQQANPIPQAMRQQLGETVASESDSFLAEESEKKSSGKPYIDLEHAKFIYVPSQKEGKWNVQAKLESPEYVAPKDSAAKGKATGKRKALIFNYRLDGNKWTELEQPKWEDVEATATATAKKK